MDGRWTLAFPDEDLCASAKKFIDHQSEVLRERIGEALKRILLNSSTFQSPQGREKPLPGVVLRT